MADYYPVLTRAIAGLDPNTAESRRAVYERARQAVVKQLRSYDPPLSESEITKERLGLEEAVRRIEAEHRAAQQPLPSKPAMDRLSPVPPSAGPGPTSQAGPPPPLQRAEPAASPRTAASPASSRSPASVAGGEGLVKVHAAAAAAASLGAATASARASALTTRAAFEAPARAPSLRSEPNFERPRVPGPLPETRAPAMESPFAERDPAEDGGVPDEAEDAFEDAPRAPKVVGLIAVVLLLMLGIGAYLARDTIASFMAGDEPQIAAPAETGEKVDDRVGASDPVPGPSQEAASSDTPAGAETAAAPADAAPPAAPADQGSLVSQRATLYDEAPDAQSGAAAASGSVNWRTEPVPSNPSEVQLVGEIAIPERGMQASLTMTRNLDETLPASHLIEIVFTLADDFANGGVANVPGILFKSSEADGGSALKGMSAKVTKNIFLIGLEKTPADHEQNMQAVRTRGWIDLPILYENGRRAVLTMEKGPPGERAFQAAFSAWDSPPVAQTPGPDATTPSTP